jgi:hypothetical protein
VSQKLLCIAQNESSLSDNWTAGSVDTRMASGFAGAKISVAESATGVVTVLDELDLNKTKEGILSYDGTILPW